ncbi:YlzJ-like family protein [Microbacteriaceae bacterium 4G12]
MILYTIVPEQLIYPVDDASFTKQRMVTYNGVEMMVEIGSHSECSVVRILSSDPQHFLQYQPGQKVWIQ